MQNSLNVIRGIAITASVIGRINMGHVELRRNGNSDSKAFRRKTTFSASRR